MRTDEGYDGWTSEQGPELAYRRRLVGICESPRTIKSGPIAAGVATAVMLAATAVPQLTPKVRPFAAAPIPRATATAAAMESAFPGLATFHLGEGLGPFELDGEGVWDEMSDGSARFSFSLRAALPRPGMVDGGPIGGFDGVLHFRRRLPALAIDPVERRLAVPAMDLVTDAPVVRTTIDDADWHAPAVEVYAAVTGVLSGTGEYAGTVLDVRNAPGVYARRGPAGGKVTSVPTVSAGLLWFLDTDRAIHTLPELGRGWLCVTIDDA